MFEKPGICSRLYVDEPETYTFFTVGSSMDYSRNIEGIPTFCFQEALPITAMYMEMQEPLILIEDQDYV